MTMVIAREDLLAPKTQVDSRLIDMPLMVMLAQRTDRDVAAHDVGGELIELGDAPLNQFLHPGRRRPVPAPS